MALVALSLQLHSKHFIRLYYDNCHIGMHLKKKNKIGKFFVAVLLLTMEEKQNF